MSQYDIWNNQLNIIKDYININTKKPSSEHKNIEIKKLGVWLLVQVRNYKYNINNMKEPIYQNKWYNFVTDRYIELDIS